MALSVEGDVVAALTMPRALASDMLPANVAIGSDPSCKALPQNHKRRIFFNVPTDNPDAFGLGYEEVDEHNIPVPGTFMDVKPFDPMRPTVCLPLGPGNIPVGAVRTRESRGGGSQLPHASSEVSSRVSR
jgi:hypothetical protein